MHRSRRSCPPLTAAGRRRALWTVCLLAPLALAACGGGGGGGIGGTTPDATADRGVGGATVDATGTGGVHPDAAPSSPPDARAEVDLGRADAATDAERPDAAHDALPPDAAPSGPPDAAAPDGASPDAARPDAAAVDARVAPDTQVPADALSPADAAPAPVDGPRPDAAPVCQCAPGELCDPTTGQCSPAPACATHADCGAGACVNGRCADRVPWACECPAGWGCRLERCELPGPCAADADCVAGRFCQGGLCGECMDDTECPGQTRCFGGQCRERAACVDSSTCLPGRMCDVAGCVPDGTCVDDGLNNHDQASALPLGFEARDGFIACDGASDWFLLDAPTAFSFSLHRDLSLRPLMLEAYFVDNPFSPADYDLGVPGTSWVSGAAGQYLIRVSAPAGGSGPYALDVRPGCAEDPFERPWRNDDAARASAIGLGATPGGLCPDDVDVFRYGGQDSAHAVLEVLSGTATASIGGRALPADLVNGDLIEVRGDAGSTYRLQLTRRRDPFNRCLAAPAVALDTPTDIHLLAGIDDFNSACNAVGEPDLVYRVTLPAPAPLTLALSGATAQSGLSVYSNCAAAALDCRRGLDHFTTAQLPAGDYFIVVDGPVEGRLTVTDSAGGASPCSTAAEMRIGFATQLQIPALAGPPSGGCLDDTQGKAVGHFNLPVRSRMIAAVAAGGAVVRASIRRACDDAVTEMGCEVAVDATVTIEPLEAGDYFLVVQGQPGPVSARLSPVPLP